MGNYFKFEKVGIKVRVKTFRSLAFPGTVSILAIEQVDTISYRDGNRKETSEGTMTITII